jgi:hypothetical protein
MDPRPPHPPPPPIRVAHTPNQKIAKYRKALYNPHIPAKHTEDLQCQQDYLL